MRLLRGLREIERSNDSTLKTTASTLERFNDLTANDSTSNMLIRLDVPPAPRNIGCMKTSLRCIFVGVSLAALYGCANMPGMAGKSLAGTWTNSYGTVWTIKPDKTFDVDRYGKGKVDIRGTYTIAGDTFTITGNEGKIPKGCEGQGVYKFSRKGNNLNFTLVSDTCKDRKKNVLSPWQMKQ